MSELAITESDFEVPFPEGWDPVNNLSDPIIKIVGRHFFALIAPFDSCLIDSPGGGCWTPPRSRDGYASAHNGSYAWMPWDRPHADKDLPFNEARDVYSDTKYAAAAVRYVDNEELGGIFAHGKVSPSLSDKDIELLAAFATSGDWRMRDGRMEMCASQIVSVPRFRRDRAIKNSSKNHSYFSYDMMGDTVISRMSVEDDMTCANPESPCKACQSNGSCSGKNHLGSVNGMTSNGPGRAGSFFAGRKLVLQLGTFLADFRVVASLDTLPEEVALFASHESSFIVGYANRFSREGEDGLDIYGDFYLYENTVTSQEEDSFSRGLYGVSVELIGVDYKFLDSRDVSFRGKKKNLAEYAVIEAESFSGIAVARDPNVEKTAGKHPGIESKEGSMESITASLLPAEEGDSTESVQYFPAELSESEELPESIDLISEIAELKSRLDSAENALKGLIAPLPELDTDIES